jgi:hypothetical protein
LSTPGRKKWAVWIVATAAVALLQIYFLIGRLNQPASVARLEWIFLACAVVGLIGSLVMLTRKEP